MHDHFIDKYEWFMRADDDVYVHTEKLEKFLRSIDSSKPHFIGQAGVGNKEEFGQLSLEPEDNFCMGGPGVILSRKTLELLVPHIEYCLKHLYSTHEDVEVGRCVRKFVDITCTWSYEMQIIFYHNFSGEINVNNPVFETVMRNAITLHPVKVSQTMYLLHRLDQYARHENTRLALSQLHRDIANGNNLDATSLNRDTKENESKDRKNNDSLGVSLTQQFADCQSERSQVVQFNYINKSVYTPHHSNPRHQLESHYRMAMDSNIITLMYLINQFSSKNRRVIEFKRVYYGYVRVNKYGIAFIIDLLMDYKQYQGKKMIIPVRRHTYALQTFGKPYIREVGNVGEFETVNVIVPLSGRMGPFKRFIANFVRVYQVDKRISLAFVLFPDASESSAEFTQTKEIINEQLRARIPIRIAQLGGHFSRAAALQRGAALFTKDSLLLFLDVDVAFTHESIERVRRNTQHGSQVYYLIVFSQYDPKFVPNASVDSVRISDKAGYFRQFGYGNFYLFLH